MKTVFLQLTSTEVTLPPVEGNDVNMLELLIKGGWVMIPLFILSFVTVYILIERYLSIRAAAKDPSSLVEKVKAAVAKGDIAGAKAWCESEDTPVARMIGKGIQRLGSPMSTIEATIENVAKIEVNRLEKNLSALATIAGAGPMIGFLGTVIGMIKAFISIAQIEGQVSAKDLASGIYEAMVTTAAGLIVGVIAYIAYNYLVALIQKIVHGIEQSAIEFMDLLQEPHQ